MIEHIPIGQRVAGAVPVRYPVAPGTEYPVESTAGGRQFGPGIYRQYLLDQRVYDGISNSSQIVGTLGRCRLRGEGRTHRISGRRRDRRTLDGDVEVEILDRGAVLHRIDQPQRGLDAERAEILEKHRMVRLKRRLVEQELDFEDLAVRQGSLPVLHLAAGVVQ